MIRRIATSPGARALAILAVMVLGCRGHGDDGLGPSDAVAGAGTVSSPATAPAASPSPSHPAPGPAPPDQPAPEPTPDCIHDNIHPVDSVSLNVYFLECGAQRIPGSRVTAAFVGCRIHFNATPRDGRGAPTCSRTWPVWQVGPEDLLAGPAGGAYTPAYTVLGAGRLSARCIVDGVRSDWLFLDLVER